MNTIRTNTNQPLNIAALLLLAAILLITPAIVFGQRSSARGGAPPPPIPTPTPVNPLPQTAPAPGVLYRESFGEAELYRPTGGKGIMKNDQIHVAINRFWIEYPGSKNTNWIASDVGQTWRFCGASDNPYEMFSPIQMTLGMYMNGCVVSFWADVPTTDPTALMPVTLPAEPYEVSFNGYPAPIAGKYLAIGLTSSAALYSNLATSGNVVLVTRPAPPYMNFTLLYELRAGGMNGTLLASGETYFEGWNQIKLRVDPVAHTVGGSVNGTDLGTFPLDVGAPKYAGFEGVGIGDNFVIRTVQ